MLFIEPNTSSYVYEYYIIRNSKITSLIWEIRWNPVWQKQRDMLLKFQSIALSSEKNCDEQKKNITVGMLDFGFDPFRLGVFFQSLVYVNAYLQSAFQNKLTYIYSKPENHR